LTAALEKLAGMIAESGWLAPLLALAAGMLTSFTPCSLSGIPLVIAYVGGIGKNEPQNRFGFPLLLRPGPPLRLPSLALPHPLPEG